ncbi:MAG: hypothetical protein H6Q40_384, partial [Deltaproteobacteria bacterium]|nr:hypothetical protein [Deltaproteobacteria bacterium]
EEPVPEGPPLLVQVLGLGDEVQFGDIHARGADHVAQVTPDAEIDPGIHRRLIRTSKPLCPGPCLFGAGKTRGYPRDRAHGHAGGTANTDIRVVLGPAFCHLRPELIEGLRPLDVKFQIPKSKSQINSRLQFPNAQKVFTLHFGFRSLDIICYLVLGMWCLFQC